MGYNKNVVIVAGGENTRFKEMSIFPKVLLPMDGCSSILEHDCQIFKNWNIWLVMNDKYELMTKQYLAKTKLDVNLVISHNHNGSANTLAEVKDMIPNEDVLFIWSDLIIDKNGLDSICQAIDSIHKEQNMAFTYIGDYRFLIDGGGYIKNVQHTNLVGNIPGIYWCPKVNDVIFKTKYPDNYDYIDLFKEDKVAKLLPATYKGKITEFKDLQTYIDYYDANKDNNSTTRFFNKISYVKNEVIKQCTNNDYSGLIDTEILWYSKCEYEKYKHIPTIYNVDVNHHSICMQWLKGYENIYKTIKYASDDEFSIIMDQWLKATKELHEVDTCEVNEATRSCDFVIEFYNKVLKRCDSISGILYKYDRNKLEKLLKLANKVISEYKDDDICKYCFIHGDMNGSNVMWNPITKDIKFIDPRGYFGSTSLQGPALYDYAKIKYCLSGYDDFNNNRYKFTSIWYDHPKKLREYSFGKYDNLLDVVVSIIWICLAEYISQDIFKANIAYHYGLSMLEDAIDNSYINKIGVEKIIVSDCDGVLTNGNSIYTADGKIAKVYGAYDSEAIEYAHDNGWKILFVTDDYNGVDITKARVSQYVDKGQAKFMIASPEKRAKIIDKMKSNKTYIVFIGDSLSDINAGRLADKFCTTNNAFTQVKEEANFVSSRDGGDGGFAEIIYQVVKEYTINNKNIKDRTI